MIGRPLWARGGHRISPDLVALTLGYSRFRRRRSVDLTRFRGHFMFTKKGDQDGKDTQAIHAGVPAADGAAASIGAEI